MKRVLIVIDMQVDFTTGSLANEKATSIVPAIMERVKEFDGDVLFTKDSHRADYLQTSEGKHLPVEHCIINTVGHELASGLAELSTEERATGANHTIWKPTFGYLDWKKYINSDVEYIEICGTCTDICVVSNALILKAMFPEAHLTVRADLCAALDEPGQDAALLVMERCQCEIVKGVQK